MTKIEGTILSDNIKGVLTINDEYASGFTLYSYAAAYEGVPVVFL